jgi:Domain of unknown function (DUF4169)
MGETKGEIINLRRARKEKARAASSKEAVANRAKFGRIRAGRDAADQTRIDAADQTRIFEEKRLEAHRREAASSDDQAD